MENDYDCYAVSIGCYLCLATKKGSFLVIYTQTRSFYDLAASKMAASQKSVADTSFPMG